MREPVYKQFDGYDEIAAAIEMSRAAGVDYTLQKDDARPYVDRLHPARLELRVARILEETASTCTLRLVRADGALPPFLAGQYVALFVEIDGVRTSRPYSISSPPNQTAFYDVTVRRVADGVVSGYLLDAVRQGDTLVTSGPAGEFTVNPLFHSPTSVFVAGGSGITPFMSMIREIDQCGLDRTVHLFYGNRDLEDAIFHHELEETARRAGFLHYHPVIEHPPAGHEGKTGLITGELVRETLGGVLDDKTFYVCGPPAMYDFCLPELEGLGIPRKRLRREIYGTPTDVSQDPAWPAGLSPDARFEVTVNRDRRIEARAGDPLLSSLERAGVVVPSLCRSGDCSLCRVKLLSGRVFQTAAANLRKSDRQFGYVHTCVSYPLENLEILV